MANYGPYMAHIWVRYGMVRTSYGKYTVPKFVNFKLWEVHGIESLRKDLYGKTMGKSCPEMFHSNGSSASLFFSMGMIWDHHIVQNNYGHHLRIGTPAEDFVMLSQLNRARLQFPVFHATIITV